MAGILISLGAGFLAGFLSNRVLDGDSASAASTAASTAAPAAQSAASSAPATVSPAEPPQTSPPPPTAGAAHPDPAPPGPQGDEAYLAALRDAGAPVDQHRDTLLVIGYALCKAPPDEKADHAAAARRIISVVGDLLTPAQAQLLAQLAEDELVC